MNTEPLETRQREPEASLPAVRFTDMRFRWPGGFGLEIADWQVASGDRVFLQGPSGAGKSTFLSLICGTVTPQAGRIEIDGATVTRRPATRRDKMRAESMGVIFQMFNRKRFLT